MHAIKDRPVVVNGQIVIRPIMVVALTYDHRLLDGREAVTFLGTSHPFLSFAPLARAANVRSWRGMQSKSRSTSRTRGKCSSPHKRAARARAWRGGARAVGAGRRGDVT